MASGIGSRLLTLAMLATARGLAAAEPMMVELRLGARGGPDPAPLALAQRTAGALLFAAGIDFAEAHVRPLGELADRVAPFGPNRFVVASRDGRWVLAAHIDRWDRDIMVIDNFR